MKRTFTLFAFLLVLFCNCAIAQPPANYYNPAEGKACSELKTALKNIISTGSQQLYDNLWSQFQVSDIKTREVGSGSSKVIYDIYSDKPGPANDPYDFTPGTGPGGQQDQGQGGNIEGQFYNREHSIPLSWFNGSAGALGPASDYIHIFPTDKAINNKRGNLPYGQVGSASFTSLNGSKVGTSSVAGISGTVFEPVDSFKGDVARAFLYFVTRYENSMPAFGNNAEAVQAFEPNTYPSVDVPYLRMMINWHNLDPVSAKEIARNNAAYGYQSNRNPYVDHPEYVAEVWNNTCAGLSTLPVNIVFFAGRLNVDQVKLEWNVAREISLDKYEVERSYNGTTYQKIGEVRAADLRSYSYYDNANENRGQQVYYRLKELDKDGHFTYSSVVAIHIPLNTKFSVYPNPATTYIRLHINQAVNGKATIQLTDITGKLLMQKILQFGGGTVQLSTANIQPGVYMVKIYFAGEQFVQKIIIEK